MKKVAAFLLVITIFFACGSAFAASPWTSGATYKDKVLGKLDFAVKNVLGGWTELINRPIKYHKDGKNVSEGVLMGVYYAIADTVGGALHLITFPIPAIDVPLPNDGVKFE